MAEPMLLRFPFSGRWSARNSPADRVPSHGSELFGSSHAIDFVMVDARGRTAPVGWRALLATERPERFAGFGAPILAPCAGRVVIAEDGVADHVARRSPVSGIPYLLGQSRRIGGGARAIAGNHVVIAASEAGPFVLVAHLRRGTLRVAAGDRVAAGVMVGECGNSGNSTEPHVHVQASDSLEWAAARGIPIAFAPTVREGAPVGPGRMPRNGEIVDVA